MINNKKAEAEPPPTFRWLDAENQPVTEGQVVNDQYKVFIDDNNDGDYDDDGGDDNNNDNDIDAENQPVTEGQVVNDQYKVFIFDNGDFDNGDDVNIMNMITLIMILMSTTIWLMRDKLSTTNTIKMMIAIKMTRTIRMTITIHEEKAESKVVDTYVL